MIDIAAARRRTAWLAFLRVGDSVRFFSGTGEHVATVEAIEVNRMWIGWGVPGARIRSWVFRDTGDCPGARTRIEPVEAVLPAIGGDEPAPDGKFGGWEAA
jgi:hypothetical protein